MQLHYLNFTEDCFRVSVWSFNSQLLHQLHQYQQLPNTSCHLVSTSSGATQPPIGYSTANYQKWTNEEGGDKLESDTAPRRDSSGRAGVFPTRMCPEHEDELAAAPLLLLLHDPAP